LFAVLAAFGFIALATLRWDAWVGSGRGSDDERTLMSKAETTRAEQPGRW